MKKIIALCLFIFMFTLNPKALDNRLYFTEDGKELFYDTEQLDKDTFMNHKDMMPGKQYEDILTISNGSSNTCKLYFKVVERDQSKLAGELLENINMQIYIDDELIYDGNAKGLDSKELGVNLQDSVYIGEYEPNKENSLLVKTELDKEYTNYRNTEESYIDWEFYGECGGKEIVVINPNTGSSISPIVRYYLIAVLILSLILCLYSTKKYKKLKRSYH